MPPPGGLPHKQLHTALARSCQVSKHGVVFAHTCKEPSSKKNLGHARYNTAAQRISYWPSYSAYLQL